MYKNLKERIESELVSVVNEQNVHAQQSKEQFFKLLNKYIFDGKVVIDWDKIDPCTKDVTVDYTQVEKNSELSQDEICQNLGKLVVMKLNGGLGTSMGCTGPKSLISVRDDLNFLDIIVEQLEQLNKKYSVSVPLVLMNSFNTHKAIVEMLPKYDSSLVSIFCFEQSKCPRINAKSLLPIFDQTKKKDTAWYPPGHGDFYFSFYKSGLLEKLINKGKEIIFCANCDNLGATVDMNILNFFSTAPQKIDFLMEVTPKTRADIKGGTLVRYENRVRLLEIAQVPKGYENEFKKVKKFTNFNTNNIWMSLLSIKDAMDRDLIDLDIIINRKIIGDGIDIIQLETPIGSAVKCFENVLAINVPRRRFLPVKTTSDLLLLMSDLYKVKQGRLYLNPERQFNPSPLIKLGSHFKQVSAFLSRFQSIPKIIDLDHLTVSGNVTFGKNTILKGTVIIVASGTDVINIPDNCILEDKIISGSLRVLDH